MSDRRERKVVSVLFCDLVGFTSASEAADPEDVDAGLRAYHETVRTEIERYGGVVEKFVGDAVMAVYGAPVAHEDDAERAVRAALAILEVVDVEVRIAVHTGEALVRLDARPELGEGMVAGDVVNTASRLQGIAAPGTVVVGQATRRATERSITYEPLGATVVKGRHGAVEVWRAVGPRASFGVDVPTDFTTTFVGRDPDLLLVQQTFERVLRERSVQLLTIVGEPGVGKTRLVAELAGWVDERPELVAWRQGRCLPYGDGVTYWALGEMVKAQAGILETDDPDVSRRKLAAVIGDEPGAEWLLGLVAPLVGAAGAQHGEREESLAAWRRFVELIAEGGPVVLVFDDLHWADPPLLEFLDHLLDWTVDAPVLVVGTARPELFDTHPGWGGGKRNTTTLNLSPLSDADTARLLAELTGSLVMPAERQAQLLERAGGNPLYAEEFVRLLKDRGPAGLEGALPDTVHAVIAARLDALDPGLKALLHDAAVLGKVFWPGALAAVGGREASDVERALHALTRLELVKPARQSSMAGEREFAFWHAIVRDVAYGQIPRAERAVRHAAAARWIEQAVGERLEDVAEVLAYHASTALVLAQALDAPADEVAELSAEAGRFLELAGDRAERLDVAAAERLYRRALELADDPALRARLLGQVGLMLAHRGELGDATGAFREQIALLEPGGDPAALARALEELSKALGDAGHEAEAYETMDRAVRILEAGTPTHELARAYAGRAGDAMFTGRWVACLADCARAMTVVERVGADELRSIVLQFRGVARHMVGEEGAEADLREALRLAMEHGNSRAAVVAHVNLADVVWEMDGPEPALRIWEAGVALGESRGMAALAMASRAEMVWALTDLGRWDNALREAEAIMAWDERRGGTPIWAGVAPFCARILVLRGQVAEGLRIAREARVRGRETHVPQWRLPALAVAGMAAAAAGEVHEAHETLRELVDFVASAEGIPRFLLVFLPDVARTAAALNAAAVLGTLMPDPPAGRPPRSTACHATGSAILAELEDDTAAASEAYLAAATAWQRLGCPEEEAWALFGLSRVTPEGGDKHLARAVELAEQLGAVAMLPPGENPDAIGESRQGRG